MKKKHTFDDASPMPCTKAVWAGSGRVLFTCLNWAPDAGLLLLRAGIGGMMLVWGVDKLLNFSAYVATFPDPLGLGPEISLGLTVLAQAPCSAFVVVGCFTRLSAVPPLATMLVAAFIVHSPDPWSYAEHALLYAIPFAAIILTGPGRISVDAALDRPADAGHRSVVLHGPGG